MLFDGALAGAAATLIVGLIGFFQWMVSNRARARGRDKELFDWGGGVIDLMSAVESLADEGETQGDTASFKVRARGLRAQASALVDKGRLFFPNVQTRGLDITQTKAHKAQNRAKGRARQTAYQGFRVKILDEVIRAVVIAEYLAVNGPPPDQALRDRMRASRRRFVSHLQREMSRSLKRSSAEKTGESVPGDPYSWPAD
jgi:hypothetical protein